jgi:hypothetical protein
MRVRMGKRRTRCSSPRYDFTVRTVVKPFLDSAVVVFGGYGEPLVASTSFREDVCVRILSR